MSPDPETAATTTARGAAPAMVVETAVSERTSRQRRDLAARPTTEHRIGCPVAMADLAKAAAAPAMSPLQVTAAAEVQAVLGATTVMGLLQEMQVVVVSQRRRPAAPRRPESWPALPPSRWTVADLVTVDAGSAAGG